MRGIVQIKGGKFGRLRSCRLLADVVDRDFTLTGEVEDVSSNDYFPPPLQGASIDFIPAASFQ